LETFCPAITSTLTAEITPLKQLFYLHLIMYITHLLQANSLFWSHWTSAPPSIYSIIYFTC